MSWEVFAWLLLGLPLLARASCDAGSASTTVNGPGGTPTEISLGALSTPPNYMTVTIINSYGVALSTSGDVAIVDANYSMSGNTSLIEGSFSKNGTNGTGVAVPDIDVSYMYDRPGLCRVGRR